MSHANTWNNINGIITRKRDCTWAHIFDWNTPADMNKRLLYLKISGVIKFLCTWLIWSLTHITSPYRGLKYNISEKMSYIIYSILFMQYSRISIKISSQLLQMNQLFLVHKTFLIIIPWLRKTNCCLCSGVELSYSSSGRRMSIKTIQ